MASRAWATCRCPVRQHQQHSTCNTFVVNVRFHASHAGLARPSQLHSEAADMLYHNAVCTQYMLVHAPMNLYLQHIHTQIWSIPDKFTAMQAGYCVLVHSAAGGCGLNALAICLAVGAVPIGTVGNQDKVSAPSPFYDHEHCRYLTNSNWISPASQCALDTQ